MPGQIGWGIIGCGKVTELKSGPAFSKVEGSSLVAVMRRNASLAADYAARHGVEEWYDDSTELIANPRVNAVYVATPPGSHMKYAIESIRAGKPVYIEKPMALNHKECDAILKEARKYNVPVFVAYYRRALPAFLKVKELIHSGAIGKALTVNVEFFKTYDDPEGEATPWRLKPEISGGGHFVDLASHLLDYLDFVFGPVNVVNSLVLNQAQKFKAEDMVMANLLLGGSIPCSLTYCFSAGKSAAKDTIEISGEKGRISFSCFNYAPVEIVTGDGHIIIPNDKPDHVQQYLIDTVVKELRGKGICNSTGESAARTNKVMDEILKDYYSSATNH